MQLIDRLTTTVRDVRGAGRARGDEIRAQLTPQASPLRSLLLGLGGAVAGALAAFFLDPDLGRTRRARYGGQLAGLLRRGQRGTERAARVIGSTAGGKLQAVRHLDNERPVMNDAELTHAVETELFRDPSVPKGRININVESGVVVLRGEVASEAQRDRLAKRAARVEGVWSVRNLLRLPGEPAAHEELVGGQERSA